MKIKLKHLTIEYRRDSSAWNRTPKDKPWCVVHLLKNRGDPVGFSESGYVIIIEDKGKK